MGFWEGECCEYCDGSIVDKKVDISKKVRGKYVFINNVPAGVCKECGTRYYAANVLKTIEKKGSSIDCIYIFYERVIKS